MDTGIIIYSNTIIGKVHQSKKYTHTHSHSYTTHTPYTLTLIYHTHTPHTHNYRRSEIQRLV